MSSDQPTRIEITTALIERTAAAGVGQVELQFCDIGGAIGSVYVPVGRLADVLRMGEWFDGSAIEGSARELESDMFLRPDPSTFAVTEVVRDAARDTATARLICEVVTPDGDPYRGDGRTVLRERLDAARGQGLDYRLASEVEFFLLPEGDAARQTRDEGGSYFEAGRGHVRHVALWIAAGLERLGIPIAASHHEVAPGQFEVDLEPLPALEAADSLVTLKAAIRDLARQRGLEATFMPKPFTDSAGSGLHVHQLMLGPDGRNAFAEPAGDYGLSSVARQFVAGQLEHSRALAAILAPTVNSYRRLVPGFEAPVAASWGRHSRSAMLRVPAAASPSGRAGGESIGVGARLEIRLPDPSCNPYLAFTAMLAAGLDGIERELEPGPAIEELGHGYAVRPVDAAPRRLPASLGEALDALETDDVLADALGRVVFDLYLALKRQEWDTFRRQVSTWEIDRYLRRA